MSVFKDVLDFLKGIFTGKQTEDNEARARKAVELLQRAKGYTYNPLLDKAVDVVPGDWDNKAKDVGVVVITTVADKTAALYGCIHLPSFGERWDCILKTINAQPETEKAKSLNKLAVDMALAYAEIESDGKVEWSEVINDIFIFVPTIFRLLFGKKK